MNLESLDLSLMKQLFLCGAPLTTIDVMISECNITHLIDIDIQKSILDNTINSLLNNKYPIKKSYQKAFLKLLIQKLETNNVEIYDDIYNIYCDILKSSEDDSTHYRHYLIKSSRSPEYITVQENINIISGGTTGLCCWQAALVLNQWCIENSSSLFGKRILELGCGIGLTGLSVIKTCLPKHYIFSDHHETVLQRACRNINLNLTNHTVHTSSSSKIKLETKCNNIMIQVIQLDWANIDEYITDNMPLPNVIIAADILYEPDTFPTLINGLKAFLATECNCIVIAATVRNADTISQFSDLLAIQNLYVDECTIIEQPPSIQTIDAPVRILKIYQKTYK